MQSPSNRSEIEGLKETEQVPIENATSSNAQSPSTSQLNSLRPRSPQSPDPGRQSGSMKSFQRSINSLSIKSDLEPQGKKLSEHVDELTESVNAISKQIDVLLTNPKRLSGSMKSYSKNSSIRSAMLVESNKDEIAVTQSKNVSEHVDGLSESVNVISEQIENLTTSPEKQSGSVKSFQKNLNIKSDKGDESAKDAIADLTQSNNINGDIDGLIASVNAVSKQIDNLTTSSDKESNSVKSFQKKFVNRSGKLEESIKDISADFNHEKNLNEPVGLTESMSTISKKNDILTTNPVFIKSFQKSPSLSIKSDKLEQISEAGIKYQDEPQTPVLSSNIEKIATMGKILTKEANELKASIKSLSDDIARTKLGMCNENEVNVNFPYHLFLIEIIINKIHMKCECFELDKDNLVISATFLDKQPIVLYDSSFGNVDSFERLNVGKSTLFAMTYDKICTISDFEIVLELTERPPCSSYITKIGQTRLNFTAEFIALREELSKKWIDEQPNDNTNILCTTSMSFSKFINKLFCENTDSADSIGVIEVTVRMSFLGKEITTALCTTPKSQGTSFSMKQNNGMAMYSCHKVEMDDQGKILLNENVMNKKVKPPHMPESEICKRSESPISQLSRRSTEHQGTCPNYRGQNTKYNEIFTKINMNELKIRVPKSTRVERTGKYDKIQELCSCESKPYNTGEQILFELPRDLCNDDNTHNMFSSNLKYTYKGCDKSNARKENRIVNVTPTNCTVPVDMEKVVDPLKDVFILKIGKKNETSDKKTALEIELVTPKAPAQKSIEICNMAQQCSSGELKADDKCKKNKDKGQNLKKDKGKKGSKKATGGKLKKKFNNISSFYA